MFKKIIQITVNKTTFIQRGSKTFRRTPLRVWTKSEVASGKNRMPTPTSATKTRADSNNFEEDGRRKYEKLEETDEKFMQTMLSLKNKKSREKSSKIILEGHRLISDAIEAGVAAECIYFTKEQNLEGIPVDLLSDDVELSIASLKQLQTWSGLTTCPGIMGIFNKPNYDHLLYGRTNAFPVRVLCDNVREPGNMGSILRCAAAVGCSKVYVTKGCVDVWDTKVLRSGCGAHFRIPVVQINWEDVENHLSLDTAVYLADNDSPSKENEGDRGDIPLLAYSEISYGDCDCVVVVGGETNGLSLEAGDLAARRGGARMLIPMENNMESLNSAMALSVILFEMKRQQRIFIENL